MHRRSPLSEALETEDSRKDCSASALTCGIAAAFVASETMPAAGIVHDADQRMKSATKKKPRMARITRMDER
jgi:hypothetical protein